MIWCNLIEVTNEILNMLLLRIINKRRFKYLKILRHHTLNAILKYFWNVITRGVRATFREIRWSGPCLLSRGLDRARHGVPSSQSVRVQILRMRWYKAVDWSSTMLSVRLVTIGSYPRYKRRLTILVHFRWLCRLPLILHSEVGLFKLSKNIINHSAQWDILMYDKFPVKKLLLK